MTRLFVATRNRHKLEEIGAILGPGVRCVGLHELANAPSTIEDAATFAGNAARKVSELAKWLADTGAEGTAARNHEWTRMDTNIASLVLADDSGLEVDVLQGAPGVHSARFAALDSASGLAAGNTPDAANNEKLLRLMRDVPWEKRLARFRCVLALIRLTESGRSGALQTPLQGPVQLFEGACEGRIAFSPRGAGGFGYDPLFIPEGFEQSFAELGEDTKNRISHRADALRKLRSWLDQSLG